LNYHSFKHDKLFQVSPTPVKKSVTIRNGLPHHQEHHKRASPPVNRDTQLVGKNPLACRHCQYSCLNKKELRNHLKSKHRINKKKTQSTAKSNQKQERPNKSLSLNPNALVDIMATNFNAEIPGVGQTKPLAGGHFNHFISVAKTKYNIFGLVHESDHINRWSCIALKRIIFALQK